MITSGDSKIRILDGHEVVCKYRGIEMFCYVLKCSSKCSAFTKMKLDTTEWIDTLVLSSNVSVSL